MGHPRDRQSLTVAKASVLYNFIDSASDRGGFSNGDWLLGTWSNDSDSGGVVLMRHINCDQCYGLRSLLSPALNGILQTL